MNNQIKLFYERALVNQVASRCEEIRKKCQDSVTEQMKSKGEENNQLEQADDGEYQNAVEKAQMSVENSNALLLKLEQHAAILDTCKNKKTGAESRLNQLHDKMNGTKLMVEEVVEASHKFPSEALFHKIETEANKYEVATDELTQLLAKIEEAKKIRDENKKNVTTARKSRDGLQKKLQETNLVMSQLRAKLEKGKAAIGVN